MSDVCARARQHIRHATVCVGLALAVLALPGHSGANPDPRESRAIDQPARTQTSVRARRAYGWWPVNANRLIVWLGVEEPWLIEVQAGCRDIGELKIRAISARSGRIQVRRDEVIGARGRCRIDMIRPADPATLRALGVNREQAQPIAITPSAVPHRKLR